MRWAAGEDEECEHSRCLQPWHTRADPRTACGQMVVLSLTHFTGFLACVFGEKQVFLSKSQCLLAFFRFKNLLLLSNFCWELDTKWRIYTICCTIYFILAFLWLFFSVLSQEQNLLQKQGCLLCFACWPENHSCWTPVLQGTGPASLKVGTTPSWQVGIKVPETTCSIHIKCSEPDSQLGTIPAVVHTEFLLCCH